LTTEARFNRNILYRPVEPVLQSLGCELDLLAQPLDIQRMPAAPQRPEFAGERQSSEVE